MEKFTPTSNGVDPIQHEEHKPTRHEHHTAHINQPVIEQAAEAASKGPNKLREIAGRIYDRFSHFTWLETTGTIAIMVIILNMFFEMNITVARKPLLQKILGSKASSQPLPPQLASPVQQVHGASGAAAAAPAPAQQQAAPADPQLLAQVLPSSGVELPVTWGNLGKQMVSSGVIDQQKFENLYVQQGGMPADMKKMLLENGNGRIKMTADNSGAILNMLWALGLGNKNEILDKGEMQDPKYGGAGKFASTGGWPLSTGQTMDHYSKHSFIRLTAEQQALVDRVSRNIYRPCCGNSTHFPDCNHGMAMLGLLELMASQGVSEANMYKYALSVNSYWFPNNYLTVASYFKKQGTDWSKVSPQTVLSAQYSSSQGYQQLLQQVQPQQAPQSKGGCGV